MLIFTDKEIDEWCIERFGKDYKFNVQLLYDFQNALAVHNSDFTFKL